MEGALGAAARRRERRLRCFWRHEQLSLQMALAAAAHHSAQPRASEVKEQVTNYTLRRQKAPSPRVEGTACIVVRAARAPYDLLFHAEAHQHGWYVPCVLSRMTVPSSSRGVEFCQGCHGRVHDSEGFPLNISRSPVWFRPCHVAHPTSCLRAYRSSLSTDWEDHVSVMKFCVEGS